MKLVKPSTKYEKEYLNALSEAEIDTGDTRLISPEKGQSFKAFVKKINEQAKGINVSDGHVPSTTLWLIDNDQFIGRVSIRHELNEKLTKSGGHIGYYIRRSKRKMGYGMQILKLGLQEAKKIGVTKALVTSDDDNIASIKIIEENGGVLENIIEIEENKRMLRRYWISV